MVHRPKGIVWEIQVRSLDHKTLLPIAASKTAPVATVEQLVPGQCTQRVIGWR